MRDMHCLRFGLARDSQDLRGRVSLRCPFESTSPSRKKAPVKRGMDLVLEVKPIAKSQRRAAFGACLGSSKGHLVSSATKVATLCHANAVPLLCCCLAAAPCNCGRRGM